MPNCPITIYVNLTIDIVLLYPCLHTLCKRIYLYKSYRDFVPCIREINPKKMFIFQKQTAWNEFPFLSDANVSCQR